MERIMTDDPSPLLFTVPVAKASEEPLSPLPLAPQPQEEPYPKTYQGVHVPCPSLGASVLEQFYRGEITWLRALATIRPLSASYSVRDLMLSNWEIDKYKNASVRLARFPFPRLRSGFAKPSEDAPPGRPQAR